MRACLESLWKGQSKGTMPELDKKKAELDDLKTWRSYAITSLIALIAFVFTRYDQSNIVIISISCLSIILLGIAIIVLQFKIKKLIKEIGELWWKP